MVDNGATVMTMTTTKCTCGSGRQAAKNIFTGEMDCMDCRSSVGTAKVGAGQEVETYPGWNSMTEAERMAVRREFNAIAAR